jgi:hypothetical protein
MSILCSWAFDAANARKIAGFSKKRVTEIDWEAVVLPLNYAREPLFYCHPNYPGVNNAPSGDPNALPPSFDAAGHVYYPTAGNAYGFVPSATHHHKHRSAR